MTLEQQRSKHAWNAAESCTKDFRNLAKGAPALIMTNGLMSSLAFWQGKGKPHHIKLVDHIIGWLNERNLVESGEFKAAMNGLHAANSTDFMQVTGEALEYLRWLRNYASAINQKEEEEK